MQAQIARARAVDQHHVCASMGSLASAGAPSLQGLPRDNVGPCRGPHSIGNLLVLVGHKRSRWAAQESQVKLASNATTLDVEPRDEPRKSPRSSCREPSRTLAHEPVVTENGPHPTAHSGAPARPGYPASSSTAVPQACHTQRSGTVPSGQPRITTKQSRPAPFPILAGDNSARTSFGSRGSPTSH